MSGATFNEWMNREKTGKAKEAKEDFEEVFGSADDSDDKPSDEPTEEEREKADTAFNDLFD